MGFFNACAAALALMAPMASATCGGNAQPICAHRTQPDGSIKFCNAPYVPTSTEIGSSGPGVCTLKKFQHCGSRGQLLCQTLSGSTFCHTASGAKPTNNIPGFGVCSIAHRTSKCGGKGEVLCTKFDKSAQPCAKGLQPTSADPDIGLCVVPKAARSVRRYLRRYFKTADCGRAEQLICIGGPPGTPRCKAPLLPTGTFVADSPLTGYCVPPAFVGCGSPGQLLCVGKKGAFCHTGAVATSPDPNKGFCKFAQETSKCGGAGEAACTEGAKCSKPLLPTTSAPVNFCVYPDTLRSLALAQLGGGGAADVSGCGGPGELPCSGAAGASCKAGAALVGRNTATAQSGGDTRFCKLAEKTTTCGGAGDTVCARGPGCTGDLVPIRDYEPGADPLGICIYPETSRSIALSFLRG